MTPRTNTTIDLPAMPSPLSLTVTVASNQEAAHITAYHIRGSDLEHRNAHRIDASAAPDGLLTAVIKGLSMITPARICSIQAAIKAAAPTPDSIEVGSLAAASEATTVDESEPLNGACEGATEKSSDIATKLAKLLVTIHTDNADLMAACEFLAADRSATKDESSDPLRKQLRRFDINWKLVNQADLAYLRSWASLYFVPGKARPRSSLTRHELAVVSRSFEVLYAHGEQVDNFDPMQEAA